MKPSNVAGSAPERRKADAPPPKPISPTWLERAALHYLERYSASTEMLRRTLARRVEKRARLRGEDPAAFAEMIAATVARAVSAGLVDDVRFTDTRLATLRRRGTSSRGVSAKLAAKGVPRDVVEAAMQAEREAMPDGAAEEIETQAAQAYAKRRRLGPYRRPDLRAAYRDRDLAALARAGFTYGLARQVIDMELDTEPDAAD